MNVPSWLLREKIRPAIVGDGNVWPAVIIEVCQHQPHALGFRPPHSGRVAYVGKCAVVVVMVELRVLALVVHQDGSRSGIPASAGRTIDCSWGSNQYSW